MLSGATVNKMAALFHLFAGDQKPMSQNEIACIDAKSLDTSEYIVESANSIPPERGLSYDYNVRKSGISIKMLRFWGIGAFDFGYGEQHPCLAIAAFQATEPQREVRLVGTTWGITIDDSSVTWIAFRRDSTYLWFHIELEEYLTGRFWVRGDTVITKETIRECEGGEVGERRDDDLKRWILKDGILGPGFTKMSRRTNPNKWWPVTPGSRFNWKSRYSY